MECVFQWNFQRKDIYNVLILKSENLIDISINKDYCLHGLCESNFHIKEFLKTFDQKI